MDRIVYEDLLELVGVLAGGFVILIAVGTLAGTPWTTAESGLVAAAQLLGIVVAILVGGIMIAITSTSDRFDRLSGT